MKSEAIPFPLVHRIATTVTLIRITDAPASPMRRYAQDANGDLPEYPSARPCDRLARWAIRAAARCIGSKLGDLMAATEARHFGCQRAGRLDRLSSDCRLARF